MEESNKHWRNFEKAYNIKKIWSNFKNNGQNFENIFKKFWKN